MKLKYRIDEESGCWVWTGSLTKKGYPTGYAHRRYWEKINGPCPAGHDVHHRCRTIACVNPDHLEPLPERAHDIEHTPEEMAALPRKLRPWEDYGL